jgi:hypothetical protein
MMLGTCSFPSISPREANRFYRLTYVNFMISRQNLFCQDTPSACGYLVTLLRRTEPVQFRSS